MAELSTFVGTGLSWNTGTKQIDAGTIPLTIAAPATATGAQTQLTITGSADTAQTASTEKIDVNINLARTVQFATGAKTTQRAMVVQAPTYAAVAASTITTAATLAVSGAPIAGTNATLTNSYALWVQSGITKLEAGTVTTALAALDLSMTWNNAGITFPGVIFANVTSTASGGNSRLIDLQVGGGLCFRVAKNGNVIAADAYDAMASTAIPAGGATGKGYRFSSTSNYGVFFGSGAPTLSAAQGSLYLRSDGSGIADRLYVNTNGTTGWTNFVSAA